MNAKVLVHDKLVRVAAERVLRRAGRGACEWWWNEDRIRCEVSGPNDTSDRINTACGWANNIFQHDLFLNRIAKSQKSHVLLWGLKNG